jgi:hypothetical protein
MGKEDLGYTANPIFFIVSCIVKFADKGADQVPVSYDLLLVGS